MNSPGTITMRLVADAVGVSVATVSKALREDPTIPTGRRREIQRTARAMGYRPNPLIATLMAQLHVQRRRNDPQNIAWIDLWPSEEEASRLPLLKSLLPGAARRAYELGYSIEVHKVIREKINAARLRQVLIARCQWGLIIPPVPENAMHFPLDLQGLAAVTVGTSLHEPVMHRVSPNLYQGSQLACVRLRAKGFRRIGLAVSALIHERVEKKWLGGYMGEQLSWPEEDHLPPLIYSESDASRFDAWYRRHRPDAILVSEPQVEKWLAAKGVSPKKRPRIVWLLLETEERNIWGIDYRGEKIGAAAVELVVGQIHRNERGSPEIPNSMVMDGIWVER